MDAQALVEKLPKVELHVHIEGTLEPEQLFSFARRNNVPLRHPTVEALRGAYRFTDLQSFLDLYFEGTRVLRREIDFYEMTMAYLQRAAAQRVVHTEIFFDPQCHTERGVPIATVVDGIARALDEAEARLGISSELIMCFLRHLDEASAFETLKQAEPFLHRIAAVGLDSSEAGRPPAQFARVFAAARSQGLQTVAHAGEEGPPEYIWQALDMLRVSRVDHGVRAVEDEALVSRLAEEGVPLTVCPLSNVRLGVFPDMRAHPFKRLFDAGVKVTVNSDDPAYFGGYMAENFMAVQNTFELDAGQLLTLALNAVQASFLDEDHKRRLGQQVRQAVEG
ncbi:MAG: adenosine deaminase [Gammaproteobacteria bacterium]